MVPIMISLIEGSR